MCPEYGVTYLAGRTKQLTVTGSFSSMMAFVYHGPGIRTLGSSVRAGVDKVLGGVHGKSVDRHLERALDL
jgi:hypothetical protein